MASEAEAMLPIKRRLREQISTAPESVFAVLDSVDEPRIPSKVSEVGPNRAVSLYRGQAAEDYWALAPYLVRVDPEILDWILEELTGTPWGIFLVSPSPLDVVRHHLRKFLTVEGPDSRPMYCRFYDPRVLPNLLEVLSPEDRAQFWQPFEEIICGETILHRP